MQFKEALWHCSFILRSPRKAYENFLAYEGETISSLYKKWHLPLSLCVPISVLISPHSYILGYFPYYNFILPFCIISFFLLIAAVYDCILWYSRPYIRVGFYDLKLRFGIAFFFHLPVTSVSFFFFIYPLLGYFFLFVAEIVAILYSIEAAARMYEISRARSLSYFIMALIFFVFVLGFFLFVLQLFFSF